MTANQLESLANQRKSPVADWLAYFVRTKKWWLVPFVVVMLLLGLLLLASGTVAAPFIYTLF